MAETTTAGRIESGNIKFKDLIVPCAAILTAASFLAKNMEMTPAMGTFLYYLACCVILVSFFALIGMLISYFTNPRTAKA
jgi:hypothetical protein